MSVIQGARYKTERIPIESVGDREEFPCAEVPGDIKNPFAASVGIPEVVEARNLIIGDQAADVVLSEPGEASELQKVARRIYETPYRDASSFFLRQLGESDLQVYLCDMPVSAIDAVKTARKKIQQSYRRSSG